MKEDIDVVRAAVRQLAWRAVSPGTGSINVSEILVQTLTALDAMEIHYRDLVAENEMHRTRSMKRDVAAEYNVVHDRAQLASLGDKA